MTQQQIFIKSVLDAWHSQVSNTDKLFDTLTDIQLQEEVAPGRNRGTYLLGHLASVHDRMLPLLGFGQQLFPQLEEPFVNKPDRATADTIPATELRGYWKQVNAALAAHFTSLQPDDWFQRHTAVSEEDFAREPHRNKLNLVINRTNHLATHRGQLIFLVK